MAVSHATSTPPATFLIDRNGTVTGWGTDAHRLLGWTASEAVGRSTSELLALDVSTLLDSPEGVEGNRAAHSRTRDGTPLDLELTAQPLLDGEGSPRSVVVTARVPHIPHEDGERDLVARAFDQSPFPVAIHDAALRYLWMNDSCAQALQVDRDAIRGRTLPEGLAALPVRPEISVVAGRMRQAVDTGAPVRYAVSAQLHGDSHVHSFVHTLWPVKDIDGTVHALGSWALDITAEQSAHERMELINKAGSAIGRTLDVGRTASELAETLVPTFADSATVDLFPEVSRGDERLPGLTSGAVTLRRAGQRSSTGGPAPDVPPGLGRPCTYPPGSPVAAALATGRSQVHLRPDPGTAHRYGPGTGPAADHAHWPPGQPRIDDTIRPDGVRCRITVPLLARGTLLGAATFSRGPNPEPFTADDLILAEELAARAAVAIDNARRYARERSTAFTLQSSLLPQNLPDQSAVEVASRYMPAGPQADVGGDWFDVIPLSGSRVALVVGDVVGHGVQAAATMGRLRTAVRTLAAVDLPPDELLTHLDDLVIHLTANEHTQPPDDDRAAPAGGLGATCLYVIYDPVIHQCTLATAGHLLPVLVTPGGNAAQVTGPIGPPLGIGNLPFETTELDLPTDSVLALFTDGLVETRDRDIDQGLTDLCRILEQPAESLDAACDTATASLLDANPTDDVALLLARTRTFSSDQVTSWDVPAYPAAVESARRFAAEQLTAWGFAGAEFLTELVVSEMVTNAIRHGAPPIQLRLIRDRTLVCEVSDGSSTAPHLRRARVFDEGGRGLLLIAQLTQSWGTRQTPTGKTIWCEQPLPTGW
jgi:PAS domain S-box-containing protein